MVLPRFVRQALAGRRPHRLRQRHAVALLRPCARHGRRRSCCCWTTRERSATSSTSAPPSRSPIVELARRVIERTGSTRRSCWSPYEEAYGEGFEELGRRMPDTDRRARAHRLAARAHGRRRDRRRDRATSAPHDVSGSGAGLPHEATAALAFAAAARIVTLRATPVAIRIATAHGLQRSCRAGYKAHAPRRPRTSAGPRCSPACSLPHSPSGMRPGASAWSPSGSGSSGSSERLTTGSGSAPASGCSSSSASAPRCGRPTTAGLWARGARWT